MFQGFTDETYNFFAAIRFNNNREFFLENHDWYERAVRNPCLELATDLGDAVRALDPLLETRPHRVVSRINRDVRFSKDKSPYRDYIWLAFRRPGEERKTTLGVYFDISDKGSSYGMGFYAENKPVMNALRRRILLEPDEMLKHTRPALKRFQLMPNEIKRMKVPGQVPDELIPWYPLRGFYLECSITDFGLLSSPKLVDEIQSGYELFAPLYRYILELNPTNEDPTEAALT